MTREEAIKIFLNRGWIEVENGTYFDGDKWRETIVVISDYFRNEYKALEQKPSGDAVSRQAVKDLLVSNGIYGYGTLIDKLPSVKLQDCDTCEVDNPCLYCKHKFEQKTEHYKVKHPCLYCKYEFEEKESEVQE